MRHAFSVLVARAHRGRFFLLLMRQLILTIARREQTARWAIDYSEGETTRQLVPLSLDELSSKAARVVVASSIKNC